MEAVTPTRRGPRTGAAAAGVLPRTTPLYDLVASGMRAYVGVRFRPLVLGAERLRLDPGTLLVCTHRSDDDVPLLCGTLYFAARLWRRRGTRAAFSVRDDLFEAGFFAGYPPGVPLPLRRLLWPLAIGTTLRRQLACLPIRSATRLRLVQLLREAPDLPLGRLPDDALAQVAARAAELGREPPATAAGLLRPEYADLLWRVTEQEELDGPDLAPIWRRRRGAALDDVRGLVEVLRAGGRLLLFPEGRPSPDGSIGPLMPGFTTLVRRGGVRLVQPLAIAYDPLAEGRTRAYVSVGRAFPPPAEGLEDALLDALRRTTPLTPGQLAARASLDGGRTQTEAELALAHAAGRPVVPELRGAGRGARVEWALAAARARPAVAERLARELASARAGR